MRQVQTSANEMKDFVANLYAGGKKPCERFGVTWDQLSKLEEKYPEITCKNVNGKCKTA